MSKYQIKEVGEVKDFRCMLGIHKWLYERYGINYIAGASHKCICRRCFKVGYVLQRVVSKAIAKKGTSVLLD